MEFNALIPELTVFNIEETKSFYIDTLGFKLEYERKEEKFIFLSFEGSQLMFEELHDDGWNIGKMHFPLGSGINFSIKVKDIDSLYAHIMAKELIPYRTLMNSHYRSEDKMICQKEFLLQDPSGYLLRFTEQS